MKRAHESVLLQETIDSLDVRDGDTVIDGTLGRAGHSLEAASRAENVFIIGIDHDEEALEESRKVLEEAKVAFRLFRGNFRDIDKFLAGAGKDRADKIILDLGVSSPQFDSSGRGFSFRKDEPLLMTMTKTPDAGSFSAYDIVNGWAEEDIANVIYAYGEERFARRIAKAIVERRALKPVETTFDLVSIIEGAVPGIYRHGKIHPATKTFQALRIAVNDELGSLKTGLSKVMSVLAPAGRIAVISFHSLEDRIVKTAMKEWEKSGLGKPYTKKPVTPSSEEISRNPRARSAKLRTFIRN